MKRKSILILGLSALLSLGLCFECLSVNVAAVARSKSETSTKSKSSESDDASADSSEDSSNSSSKSSSKNSSKTEEDSTATEEDSSSKSGNASSKSTENNASETSEGGELTESSEGGELTESAKSEGSNSTKSNSTKSNSSKSNSIKSSAKSSGSSSTDANGNKLLMTESQRRKAFLSKTNPKRGTKPAASVPRPALNGFAYADFGTFNSYNSDNNLGGTPVYLLGTIMNIEKAAEDEQNYHCVLAVNDCDGYQWYVRAIIAKNNFDNFKTLFNGKAGYLFGIYSGYSGVTSRPMIDVNYIQPNGAAITDLNLFR